MKPSAWDWCLDRKCGYYPKKSNIMAEFSNLLNPDWTVIWPCDIPLSKHVPFIPQEFRFDNDSKLSFPFTIIYNGTRNSFFLIYV